MLYNPIGEAILRILERTDCSQSTMASRAGVSDTTVSRWVHGTRPRADQWSKILQGLRCSAFELEVELARVRCEYCIRQARALNEPIPVFASSPLARRIEETLGLDLELVDDNKRAPMQRLRDLLVTIAAQCEPLLREFAELHAGCAESGSGKDEWGMSPSARPQQHQ